MKKTVVFDFDGVIHSYTSGWKGASVIPDPPVPGIKEAISDIRCAGYEVVVVSTRCATIEGHGAVRAWLIDNEIEVDAVKMEKPPAIVYIDDRAICFDGNPDNLLDKISGFAPWYANPTKTNADRIRAMSDEMTDREKLVELQKESVRNCDPGTNCLTCCYRTQTDCMERITADYMLANGVTVQRWIPVTERLPDSERVVLVSALTKTFRHRRTLMAAHIGHHEFTTEDTDWREYEGDTEYDEENDCFWIPECWYEVNAIDDNGNWIIDSEYDVTHWMPRPEPPKEDAE